MIISQQNNTTEMMHTSFADYKCLETSDVGLNPNIDKICECLIGKCDYSSVVFADMSDSSSYKNDISTFLVKVDGTVFKLEPVIKLVDSNNVEIEIDTSVQNDYNINQVFDFNGVFVGFTVQWIDVLRENGPDKYSFKYTITSVVSPIEMETVTYQLYNYMYEIAKDTIKLTWKQRGIIESTFDFTDLDVTSSIRLFGSMKYLADGIEIDEYENVKRKNQQIQTKVKNNYEMVTELIPKEIGDVLTKDFILANEIEVTTYNQKTYLTMLNQKLKVVEVSDFVGNYRDNNTGSFRITLENETQDTVKRNIKL